MRFTNIHIEWTDSGAKILATIPMTCPICGTVTETNVEHTCGEFAPREAKIAASIPKAIDIMDALRDALAAVNKPKKQRKPRKRAV
jgi:Ni,Fe-hydrogenase III small subunit